MMKSKEKQDFLLACFCFLQFSVSILLTLLASEPSFFSLPMWTEDWQLSRNPPHLQCQVRTAEACRLLTWTAPGLSLLSVQTAIVGQLSISCVSHSNKPPYGIHIHCIVLPSGDPWLIQWPTLTQEPDCIRPLLVHLDENWHWHGAGAVVDSCQGLRVMLKFLLWKEETSQESLGPDLPMQSHRSKYI